LIATLVLAIFAPLPALATSFSFSYEWASGKLLEGTFDGDVDGDLIENIVNISAGYDGTDLELYIFPLAPIASFTGITMDLGGDGFVGPLPSGFVLNADPLSGPSLVVLGGIVEVAPYESSRWTVMVIPEPSTFALLLGGTVALAVARRRR
jgi:hypothetical protein